MVNKRIIRYWTVESYFWILRWSQKILILSNLVYTYTFQTDTIWYHWNEFMLKIIYGAVVGTLIAIYHTSNLETTVTFAFLSIRSCTVVLCMLLVRLFEHLSGVKGKLQQSSSVMHLFSICWSTRRELSWSTKVVMGYKTSQGYFRFLYLSTYFALGSTPILEAGKSLTDHTWCLFTILTIEAETINTLFRSLRCFIFWSCRPNFTFGRSYGIYGAVC